MIEGTTINPLDKILPASLVTSIEDTVVKIASFADLTRAVAGRVRCPARRAGLVHQGLERITFFVEYGCDVLSVENNTVKGVFIDLVDLTTTITKAHRQEGRQCIWCGCLFVNGGRFNGDTL